MHCNKTKPTTNNHKKLQTELPKFSNHLRTFGDGSLIELIFNRSEKNEADVMTKHATEEEHMKHFFDLIEEA